ncbi:MAG: glycolate oxidase subunit GlcE [Rhodobacteraceae bacterium]|nr:glycolate oxidase subunit GlcE [Paracoccaceae bacterium]
MRPMSESELAEAIRSAEGPLRVRGGGTRPVGRPVTGAVLETGGVQGVVLYEPGALTLVARAGTPLAEVEAALAAEGQMLPFEPMDHRPVLGTAGAPTVGGVVAGNVSGPRRVVAGACRDSMIGVRFVDGAGTVLRNGGRVMKNVTGYDLVRLMAGSYGTLGVLSEVAFKVLPVPEAEVSLVLEGVAPQRAVAAMAAALGSPYGVSGAAREPAGRVLLRLEGLAGSVAHRAGALSALLARFGAWGRIEKEESRAAWASVRDVAALSGLAGDVWQVSVKPSDAPAVMERAGGVALLDWGGGLVWLVQSEGTDLRAKLAGLGGHATLVRASEATRARIAVFHPEPAPLAQLAAGLRAKFDPRGVLNPGLMG